MNEVLHWLVAKTGLPEDRLVAAATKETALTTKGQRIEFRQLATDDVRLHAVRYTHPDDKVQGRQWITEIGMRQILAAEHNHVECTVLLKTEEISIRVDERITATRPLIVKRLLDTCAPTSATVGADLLSIDEGNATRFLEFIDSRERTHPIILVSPKVNRTYAIQPTEILYYVAGIADVVVIYPETDVGSIRTILGKDYCAWNGDIKIIYPHGHHDTYIAAPIFRLTLYDIETMLAAIEVTPMQELLSLLTHRVNWLNSWRHISFDNVKEEKRRHLLHVKRQELQASGASSKEMRDVQLLFEEVNQQLEQSNRELRQKIEDTIRDDEAEFVRKNEQMQELKAKITRLEVSNRELLNSAQFAKARLTLSAEDTVQRDLITAAINRQISVRKSLELVQTLFPDRLIVLESAYESAALSDTFRYPERALELLIKLVTAYWDAISRGSSDKAAGDQIFGKNDFAARESETVERKGRGRELRTFPYKGEDVVMLKHLKHGVKDSAEETLRIHFHWDADDKKIVIGHCGPHLDFD